jgi:hypothetical protein
MLKRNNRVELFFWSDLLKEEDELISTWSLFPFSHPENLGWHHPGI